jgi:deoxycytidylate deaminase
MIEEKWILRFFELAELVGQWSKDPRTKVGAVIYDHRNVIVSLGYNGFPRGVHDDRERYLDQESKYRMIVHAEANAILTAPMLVRSYTLLSTKAPCSECTKLIIQSGIIEVVCPPWAHEGRWAEDGKYSRRMLAEAGVHLRLMEEKP